MRKKHPLQGRDDSPQHLTAHASLTNPPWFSQRVAQELEEYVSSVAGGGEEVVKLSEEPGGGYGKV